ncbi:hypothetical protein KKF34_13935 [Myxococcota bacterium]|nr:hypothetical protein [Myxococcota bacterium]MBU1382674.1 hypothetical protein [Myxococcota bacterium]MBU1497972.1 hypothetical protein [Myxococcota bacterium]
MKNEKIKKLADELYEIRIPPTGKGGVARLYFCLSNTKNALVILEGELKKKNKGKMVDQAKSNLVKLRKRESEDGQNKKR